MAISSRCETIQDIVSIARLVGIKDCPILIIKDDGTKFEATELSIENNEEYGWHIVLGGENND